MFVLSYYPMAYYYHININLYALQVFVYILDYAFEYTTLSEWYDIQYMHWCFANWNTFPWDVPWLTHG